MKEIANYFVSRENSGFVEGLNNRIKVLKRRAYGIVDGIHLFQRICLDLNRKICSITEDEEVSKFEKFSDFREKNVYLELFIAKGVVVIGALGW
jgi:Transposase and inactivated derivatives